MKFYAKNMNICELDIGLLCYLHAVKIATYEQINRDIYKGYHLASVCNRIYRLESNGLVCGMRDRMLAKGKRIISITRKGFEEFVARGGEVRIELKSDAVKHDLALVDIRFHLMNANRVLKYYSENEIQTWGSYDNEMFSQYLGLNSDALLGVRFSKGDVIAPLEFEANSKTNDRYELLVKKYYSRDDVPLVLYLCDNQALIERIARIERQLYESDQPKFFYKLISELGSDDKLTFSNYNSRPIQLGQASSYK